VLKSLWAKDVELLGQRFGADWAKDVELLWQRFGADGAKFVI